MCMRCSSVLVMVGVVTGFGVRVAPAQAPPLGPPWNVDFMAARQEAMKEGKAIFMYFTKT